MWGVRWWRVGEEGILFPYQSVHYVLVSALSQYLAGVFNKHCLLTFLVLFCLFVVFFIFQRESLDIL